MVCSVIIRLATNYPTCRSSVTDSGVSFERATLLSDIVAKNAVAMEGTRYPSCPSNTYCRTITFSYVSHRFLFGLFLFQASNYPLPCPALPIACFTFTCPFVSLRSFASGSHPPSAQLRLSAALRFLPSQPCILV